MIFAKRFPFFSVGSVSPKHLKSHHMVVCKAFVRWINNITETHAYLILEDFDSFDFGINIQCQFLEKNVFR